ncbi:MAG: haloalkane dehalogenase [bacterium]
MQILRTPDARFENLPDFPFAPHYREVRDADGTMLRICAIDEGPRDAAPVLLMHGEPSWSYLYRRIVSRLVAAGHRVVAPDLIGFGRSDKPSQLTDYTYERHVGWMRDWLLGMDLQRVTFFGQDWGGLIGLRLVAAEPQRFARLVVANTALPVGTGFSDGFNAWLEFSQKVPELPIGAIVDSGTQRALTAAERAAYDAPFPDEAYKAGARCFPMLVPITPQHASVAENKAAWTALESFTRPCLTAFSDADAVTRGGEKVFQERIPGAKGQPHVTIENAGHFLQEDKPDEIADLLHRFIAPSA